MSRSKKKVVFATAMVLSLVISACLVYGYGNQETHSLSGITVIFSNSISTDLLSANASTWTGSPSTDAYVSATFYWMNSITGDFGSIFRSNGNYGAAYVSVSVNDIPNLDLAHFEGYTFYKVISNHIASYNGSMVFKNGLTTRTRDLP